MDNNKRLNEMRLSDRILFAMELALDQKDVIVAEMLSGVLEVAMTRNAGGQKFVERRDYPESVTSALDRLDALRNR